MSSMNEVQLIFKDINEVLDFLKDEAESKIYYIIIFNFMK